MGSLLYDVNTGTAVGGGAILRTTNGGTTWTSQHNPGVSADGASFTDANNGTAVGSEGKIMKTTDGGTTWFQQNKPGLQTICGGLLTQIMDGAWCGGAETRTTDGRN